MNRRRLMISRAKYVTGLLNGFLVLAYAVSVHAGTLTNVSLTLGSYSAGATTSYTLQFRPSATGTINNGDFIILDSNGGALLGDAGVTLGSISGGGLTGNISFRSSDRVVIWLTGGEATSATTVTVVYNNVPNPGSAGTSPTYSLSTTDGGSTIDSATIPGTNYLPSPVPTVSNPIPDRTGNTDAIPAEDGETVIEADLNNVFTDGDSDPLTFSVETGHDISVVTAAIVGNQLSVTGVATGTTTVTIKADDLDDGFVTDSFEVQVHGLLTPADVEPDSLEAGATGNVAITFTPSTTLVATDQIFVDWPTGFTVSSATLGSITGGTTNITVYTNPTNTGFRLNSGTFNAGSLITITMQNITNPGTGGNPGTYRIRAQDSGDQWFGLATIPGDTFTEATVPTVVSPISDLTVAAEDGEIVVEPDLNNVFFDGDGDPMTFTVEPGHDTSIATASVVGNQLSVTGMSQGDTTITVKADDMDDGFVTDSFIVTVLGLLSQADVQPASLVAGATGDVVVTFSPSTTLLTGDQIVVVYPSGFTVNTATLGSVSPGTASLNLFANPSNSVLQITSGSFSSGSSISITLQNITNPAVPGNPGNYTIRAQDSGDTVFAVATVPGDTFVNSVSNDTSGVFRPSNGLIYLKSTNDSGFADAELVFGLPGDIPITGDWDGDGVDTIGIYRNGVFYLRNYNTTGVADLAFGFGQTGDLPVAGDWDGDGDDTVGIYRNGQFMLRNSNSTGSPDMTFALGITSDEPIAGDWDGDGDDSVGVFRPSNGLIYLKNENTTGIADIEIVFGIPNDKPTAGDWNGDGIDTIGVYRDGLFLLRNTNTTGYADAQFALGVSGDLPISGKWGSLP